MAEIGKGLRGLLVGESAITAVVAQRVYAVVLPQAPILPAVTYLRVSGEDQASNSGGQDYGWGRWQIDAWASTFAAANELGALIQNKLHAFKGSITIAPDTFTFQGIFMLSARDLYEPEPKQFRDSRDYMVWFEH